MCGIAGVLTNNLSSEDKRLKVKGMVSLLAHRGPDSEGIWCDDQLCLGHRRLSIIDLSQNGYQPMISEDHVLVFNGEIYNYLELRRQLENLNIRFQSKSDTEVLLQGYRVWGSDILTKIRGMFAFALWDSRNRKLFCARDPFGKKPFYYHWTPSQFVFASEIEAVVKGLGSRPEVNMGGLSHYLSKGYFLPESTIYSSVSTLGAGQCMEVSIDPPKIEMKPYWEPRFSLRNTIKDNREILKEKCEALISQAIKRRFESDVPVGVILSGGVDSSLVSLMASEHQTAHRTFTVSFKNANFDEASFASQVAMKAGSDHVVVDGNIDDMPTTLSLLIEAYGEPFGDYSAIPCYSLFKAVKPYGKVGLTGDGGDEVFAGYADAKVFLMREMLRKFIGVGDYFPESLRRRMVFSQKSGIRRFGYALQGMQSDGAMAFQSLRSSGWTRFWREKSMRPDAWNRTGKDLVERNEAEVFLNSGQIDIERYFNMNLERLTQDFLVKIDRASMAHSVEVRCPFLDIDLFTYVSGLSYQMLLEKSEPKSVLKDALDSRMGNRFARRKKMGFTPPLAHWLREQKNLNWLESRLTNKNFFTYSLFDPDTIRQLLTEHKTGKDHTGRLWNLIFLHEWHAKAYGSM